MPSAKAAVKVELYDFFGNVCASLNHIVDPSDILIKRMKPEPAPHSCHGHGGGCPGSRAKAIRRDTAKVTVGSVGSVPSQLAQWPCQIKLVPVRAPYFDGANLLIAADCTAFAYGNFHREFMRDRVTMIGCPKLDGVNYAEKLTQIFKNHNIASVTVTRMTVPCCGGLSYAVQTAIANSGKNIPLHIVTISPDGNIIP